jgi:hypothetical protein
MQLTLTNDEAMMLREALASYLPELRREVARTESREYRHPLVERERLLERLVDELGRSDG